jgi:hypothetical protein
MHYADEFREGPRLVRPAKLVFPDGWTRFFCQGPLERGGTLDAWRTSWDTGAGDWREPNTDDPERYKIQVYDFNAAFCLPEVVDTETWIHGTARYWPDRKVWEIVTLEHIAQWIKILTGDSGLSNCTLDSFSNGFDPELCWPDQIPVRAGIAAMGDTTTSGLEGIARFYDEADGSMGYECMQLECYR